MGGSVRDSPSIKISSIMALLDDIYAFTRKDIGYIFHGPSLQVYQIKNSHVIEKIQAAQVNGKDINKNTIELLEQLESIIKSASPTIKLEIDNADHANSFILPISGNCNLKCPYCFARQDNKFGFDDYSEQDMRDVIDFIYRYCNRVINTQISFFGGEPLLNFDIIRMAVTYSRETYPDWNVSFSITTNGTICSERVATFLADNHIALMISIDGPKSENNLRRYANGRHSVDKVLRNINFFLSKRINIQLRATLTNNCQDIVNIYDFFENIGLPFSIVFAYKSANKSHSYSVYDDETLSAITLQFDELVDYYTTRILNGDTIHCMSILDRLQQLEDRVIKPISCSGGHSMFSITNVGDIYSCEHLVHDRRYAVGTIHTGIDKVKIGTFQSIPLEQIPACSSCPVRYLCNGGCFSEKVICDLKINDSLSKPDCNLIIAQWTFIFKLYGAIKNCKPDYLKSRLNEKK